MPGFEENDSIIRWSIAGCTGGPYLDDESCINDYLIRVSSQDLEKARKSPIYMAAQELRGIKIDGEEIEITEEVERDGRVRIHISIPGTRSDPHDYTSPLQDLLEDKVQELFERDKGKG